MIISNTTKEELERALEDVNLMYANNVIWNNFESLNKKQTRFRLTLRVKDSYGPGAKLGYTSRHTINACWHVHGDFFDCLFNINPNVKIQTAGRTLRSKEDNWQDWNIGSVIYPLYYSQACEC